MTETLSPEALKRGNSSMMQCIGFLFSGGIVERYKNACSREVMSRHPARRFSESDNPPKFIMQEVPLSMSVLKLSMLSFCDSAARRVGEKERKLSSRIVRLIHW